MLAASSPTGHFKGVGKAGGKSDRYKEGGGVAHCPHAPNCVGCSLYGLPYGEQLGRKRKRVEQALAQQAPSLGVRVAKPVGSPRLFGYRNQVKLVARRSRRGLLLGVYKPGTHQVVDVSRCPVHDALVARALEVVERAIEREEVPIYDERNRSGWLRYVVVRSSWYRRTAQVVAVVRDRAWRGERRFVERLRKARGVGSVVLNVNDTAGNTILSEDYVACTRYDALIERVGTLRLKFRPASFVQGNLGAARRAYALVAELANLAPGEVAVDLYCGVGAVALLLACSGADVYGIEASRPAVRDASENLKVNGIHNARFIAGAAGPTLAKLSKDLPRVDVVTLNPPRKGAPADVLAAIDGTGASRVVYMSCNPDTLARDMAELARYGYRCDEVTPFDFLPQTEHVECVALLTREKENA